MQAFINLQTDEVFYVIESSSSSKTAIGINGKGEIYVPIGYSGGRQVNYLLQENGSRILLEDGDRIMLE